MIHTLLIANRGEIASRIIRTCRKIGIRSVAVFSEADQNAPYVKQADLAVALGGNSPEESYLDIDKILDAAALTEAQAIHPGYGFLAENAGFARRCAEAGLIFVGPHPEAIEKMGLKREAKALVAERDVPVIPGYDGAEQSATVFQAEAEKMGYPVLLKASAGGGGKGMRIVREAAALEAEFAAAKREAENAFGDGHLILERYFDEVRHVEVQIMGDQHGKVLHLLERECSLQRRYQKVLEESPSPALDPALRDAMTGAAIRVAEVLQYDNAGTVEFILTPEKEFFFLEVNTRLQVEHPVSEMVTGLDIVQLQIESAEGKALTVKQEDIQANGYALEVRLYAEDPAENYQPATGTILKWEGPEELGQGGDIRLESAVETGSEISVYYDPMIAKLVVHAEERLAAFRKMDALLRDLACLGPVNNREFLLALVRHPQVQAGEYHTHFLKELDWSPEPLSPDEVGLALCSATLAGWQRNQQQTHPLQSIPSGWRNNRDRGQILQFQIEGDTHEVEYRENQGVFELQIGDWQGSAKLLSSSAPQGLQKPGDSAQFRLQIGSLIRTVWLAWEDPDYLFQYQGRNLRIQAVPRFPERESAQEKGGLVSPMPCQVQQILVQNGDPIKKGDPVAILVSMKMENTLYADQDGTVEEVYVEAGQNLEAGVLLMKITSEAE